MFCSCDEDDNKQRNEQGDKSKIKNDEMLFKIEQSEYVIGRIWCENSILGVMVIVPWLTGVITIFAQLAGIKLYMGNNTDVHNDTQTQSVVICEFIRKFTDIFGYLSISVFVMLFRVQFHSFRIQFVNKILKKHGLYHKNNLQLRSIVQSSFVANICCCSVFPSPSHQNYRVLTKQLESFTRARKMEQQKNGPYCTHILPNTLNASQFIIDMNQLLHPYKVYVKQFKYWIIFFLIFNFITYTLIAISTILYLISNNDTCNYSLIYYFHDWFRFSYFLLNWILVVEPISTNHSMLLSFTEYFNLQMVFSPTANEKHGHSENLDNEKEKILKYLEKIISSDSSPFEVASMIPTSENLTKLLIIVFITMAFDLFTSIGFISLNISTILKDIADII